MNISNIKNLIPNCPFCNLLMKEDSYNFLAGSYNKEYKCPDYEYSIKYCFLNDERQSINGIIEYIVINNMVIHTEFDYDYSTIFINGGVIKIPKVSFLKESKKEVLNKIKRYLILV